MNGVVGAPPPDQVATGLGPLRALLDDDHVTDVLVNGTAGVWVDAGHGLVPGRVALTDPAGVRRLAVRLAALAGQRLDDAAPYVDGQLPGGIRLHAVLPPLVDGAAHISLRVPRRRAPSLVQLQQWGMVDQTGVQVLTAMVRARVAFLLSGGTGVGKTTLLGALLAQVPARERVVVVEDVRELAVEHPHVVRLQARSGNVEGRGEIPMVALVRQSLRMRPDRVVVGEVRGAEVRDLLMAMNTGHEGGCGTLHANACADVVARVEALGALAGLGREAARTQLASAVQVLVHCDRSGGPRRVAEIAVLHGRDGDGLSPLPALTREREGWRHGPGLPMLHSALGSDPTTGRWGH